MPSHEIAIEHASVEDAEDILDLQKLAYVSEAEIVDDFAIPPLHQTIDQVKSEFEHQVFLKIDLQCEIIGSVRCYEQDGTCYVGKLIVHPDHQNRGLGTRLLLAAEARFPAAKRYELFTGERSAKNLHIYRKNGYRIFKSHVVSERLTLVFLEKANEGAN
jgi:ribosomal protein S18 acetylase RimI-like enzyme